MSEKLDYFSKILLATGQINYMASIVDGVNNEIKWLPNQDGILSAGISEREEVLKSIVDDLTNTLEKLGDLMNGQDMCKPIDERITAPAFHILVHGEDELETEY